MHVGATLHHTVCLVALVTDLGLMESGSCCSACSGNTCTAPSALAAPGLLIYRACHADDPDFGWTVVIYTIQKLRILPSHSPNSKAAKARKLLSHQKAGSPAAVEAAAGVPSGPVPKASVADGSAAMPAATTQPALLAAAEPAGELSAASKAAVRSVDLEATSGRCCKLQCTVAGSRGNVPVPAV